MNKKLLLLVILFTLNAFSQSGEIDSSFGIDGKVTTGFGSNTNVARCVAFQPDGKFIVGGDYVSSRGDNDFALARYNNDGTLDTTFGVGGKVATNFLEINHVTNSILSLHVLPNGKIMAFGSASVAFTPEIAVVRYNQNGTVDTTFGNNGKLISLLTPMDYYGTKLVFQTDGKFVIAGTKFYNSDPSYYIGMERYTEDGALDMTYGTNGQTVTSYGTGKSYPSTMLMQADGKMVVAGRYIQNNIPIFAVMRFTVNGTLDTSFSGDGKVTTTFGAGASGEGMHVSVNENGKIILVGNVINQTSRNIGVVQYNADGSLDTTFDGDGKALTPFDLEGDYSLVNSMTRQPDGKFLVVCDVSNYMLTTTDFVIRRYNSDTSADTGFGTDGEVATTFDTGLNEAQSAAIAPDGKIVVVGRSVPLLYGHVDFAVTRYSSNGAPDLTLDGDGELTTAFEKGNDRMKKLLVLPNDKILAVGISDHRNANNSTASNIILSRYNSDGSLDASFGNAGKIVSLLGGQLNTVSTAALQSDGKIVVGNMFYNFGDVSNSYEIIRYNADGSLDNTFGTNGKQPIAYYAESIAFQPDGKIIVGGNANVNASASGYAIARYNSNGAPDTSYDGDGSTLLSFSATSFGRATVMLQSDNKIVLSGTTLSSDEQTIQFATARYNINGSLDSSFGENGIVKTSIGNVAYAYAGFIQPSGKIIIAGKTFNQFGGPEFSSIRYNSDGSVDITYGTNGISSGGLWADYKDINTVFLQPDGKLMAVLTLQNGIPGNYDFNLRRFNPDGTADVAFGGSNGVLTSFYGGYDEAFSVGLQSDNKVVIGGTTHNSINYDFALTRYNNVILGVEDNAVDPSTVILYPNPVRETLHMKIGDASGLEITGYCIYTLLGQLVGTGSNNEQEADTSNLNRGIYAIVINTNNGNLYRKFVKD
ncbi:MAG TPA: T9SS type A sorting domain-containing protein [Flavobacterium sp.]|jgi:uncharacterized delta-60 repeat protein